MILLVLNISYIIPRSSIESQKTIIRSANTWKYLVSLWRYSKWKRQRKTTKNGGFFENQNFTTRYALNWCKAATNGCLFTMASTCNVSSFNGLLKVACSNRPERGKGWKTNVPPVSTTDNCIFNVKNLTKSTSRTKKFETLPEPTKALKPHFVKSNPEGPLIVFVSKVG